MPEGIYVELERDILNYSEAVRILKDVYLKSFEKDDLKPSLKQLIDTGVYLRSRVLAAKSELLILKSVNAVRD